MQPPFRAWVPSERNPADGASRGDYGRDIPDLVGMEVFRPARLSEARIAMLPWGQYAVWAAAPPLRARAGRDGGRLCHLCAASYDSMACGPQCPRYYQMSRRSVTWVRGFWVPISGSTYRGCKGGRG